MKKILFFLLILTAGILSADEKIVAEWDFSKADPLNAGTTKLALRGQSVIQDGMLIASNGDITKPSGAIVRDKNFKNLTPQGAFTLSVTFMVGPKWTRPAKHNAYLFDTKYVVSREKFHKGFILYLSTSDGNHFTPCAAFGFGDSSTNIYGKRITLAPEKLYTLEMTFNARGKVFFRLDGTPCGDANVPIGFVVPSDFSPVLGDRVGSDFCPLGGGIQKVVLKELPFEPASLEQDPYFRTVFERGEQGKTHHFLLGNFSPNPMENITINATINDRQYGSAKVSSVSTKQRVSFQLPVDTMMIPGNYLLTLTATDAAGKKLAVAATEFSIVPAYGDFMPVVMWGTGDVKTLADIGFTHQGIGIIPHDGQHSPKNIPSDIRKMDANLKDGLYIYSPFHLMTRYNKKGKFLRKDRKGANYPRDNVEASNPAVRAEVAKVVEDTAKAVGEHPAWDSVLSNSEVRDSSNPSFTGIEEAAFKKFAGYGIPANITSKYPPAYETTPGLPWNRVLPEDNQILTYLRWFWRTGDGWNDLHTLVTNSLHKHIKHHFWTFYDPVVRVPPQWGSGGKVDAVSHWTYTNPDPIKIGQATDEVIAMAQGQPGQQAMSMTQIIWYRSVTSPKGTKVANTPEWVKKQPEALYITIPPDCIREALWSKISRRLDGIMYHGLNSLLPNMKHSSYRFTNGETKDSLREVLHRVVQPLGPALKAIPEREPEVAILESFTSTLYARQHASMGWSNGWIADLHLALQWGHFQPTILFEEHLLHNMQGNRLKVLFLPGLEVITENVAAKLRELQKQGVILVGDEFTCPAVSPDFRIKSYNRKANDPVGSKATLQKLGKEIATMLAPYYQFPFSASSQDIVLRSRGNDRADYLFLVNDKRTFGNYLGQWGLVMEKGLPLEGTVTVNHHCGAAYDVVNHKPIAFQSSKGKTTFNVSLAPADGALILLTEKPIAKIDIAAPASPVAKGEAYEITFQVKDTAQKVVPSVIPLEVTLTSSDGVKLPGSGYYAAQKGVFTLKEYAATNMTAGKVTILVRDLASGKTATSTFLVK